MLYYSMRIYLKANNIYYLRLLDYCFGLTNGAIHWWLWCFFIRVLVTINFGVLLMCCIGRIKFPQWNFPEAGNRCRDADNEYHRD